jgi:peptidoglycan/LPS O-acetylase OafA/YrhL
MVSLLFLPVARIQSVNWTLSVECGITAALALVALFLYKKRKWQITLCYIILGLLLCSYLIVFVDFWYPNQGNSEVFALKVPIVFPLFAIVLDILAILAIRKDEKLVRSLDRLR